MSVDSNGSLPKKVDVTVVGAGIIGVATAYELVRKGLSVLLVEKGYVAGEQSSRNWGWCRKQNRDEREIPLIKFSMERWAALTDELGEDSSFRPTGITYLSDKPSDITVWSDWVSRARSFGVDSRMLSAQEARAASCGAAGIWLGGVISPTDGRAEPSIAVPLLAKAACKLGVELVQGCAVRGFELAAGRVHAVVTERGVVKTQTVVCAAGAWSSMFCRRHHIALPQAVVYGTALCTGPAPEIVNGALSLPGVAIRRRLDGGYTLGLGGRGTVRISPQGLRYGFNFLPTLRERRAGLKFRIDRSFLKGPEAFRRWNFDERSPFEEIRTLHPDPDPRLVSEAMAAFVRAFPALKGIGVARSWGGCIDSTPDTVPVISYVEEVPGLFISTGYSGHGFGIGLGAGRLAADLINNDHPVVDPSPFRYGRLVDGTKPAPSKLF
ncbi:NAD(P)/FAD-dependent oxidoreductase [Paralcaligenes ureilyticus]|uniref:NAD(P)/FAD-dependent oxidoreductase n=1 Tax=Paralcaligenes ureilyticus TaxID=627131 RepID=UPI001FB5F1EE|nr:FAD-binding oxidoreductase [Paralcaligenes ureilyticus]